MTLKKCSKCLYDENHPFGITFTEGVCSGCITHEEKNNLDWHSREQTLRNVLEARSKKTKSVYDCLIPIRGDAEDYFVVDTALKFNLRPLIVAVNDHFLNDIGWHNLHNLITAFDVDSIIFTPELSQYKELVRTSLRKHNHAHWPSIALHTAFPVHVALSRKIPLIIWGAAQSVEQVGKFSHLDEIEMSGWHRLEHDLFGVTFNELIGTGAQVTPETCDYYRYPKAQFQNARLTGIYLSNFLRWDPLSQNQSAIENGFLPQQQNGTYDVYERAGSSTYYQIHDFLKLERCGYKKVRDQLCRDIRHGYISRNNALEAELYFNQVGVEIDGFFEWLGVTKTGKEWFLKHRLKKPLVKSNQQPEERLTLEDTLTAKLADGRLPQSNFLSYYKGI